MEFEYWWLLGFPVFFALGWIAARIDIKQIVSESRALPRSYFKGLNFLLNEQPDKAIEAFIEVVKVDPETVDLHFALGSLFRRRGEYDRAIRMHQNLLDRADLRRRAEAAGADGARPGLPQGRHPRSRRGSFLQARKDQSRHGFPPLPARDLRAGKGLAARDRDDRAGGDATRARWRSTCASWRSRESAQSRPDAARRHLDAALEANRKCVRASLLWGDLERSQDNVEKAIEHWKRVESQNPAYLALVAQRLVEAYRDGGRAEEGLTLLRRLPRALSVARPARHGVPADAGGQRPGAGLRDRARRAASATRPCSASTTCSRRRSSPPARPTSAAISSW